MGESLAALVASLRDPDPHVRATAARALRDFGDREAVSALIQTLLDPDDAVGTAAAVALGALRDPRAVEPLRAVVHQRPIESPYNRSDAVVGNLEEAETSEDPEAQLAAWDRLERMGEDAIHRIIEHDLLAPVRRGHAATALAACAGIEAIPDLVLLLRDKDWFVRDHAVESLDALDDGGAALSVLEGLLSEPDYHTLSPYIGYFTARPHTWPILLPELRAAISGVPGIRLRNAMRAIGTFGGIEDVEALSAHACSDKRYLRLEVARSLGKLGFDEAIPTLLVLFGHQDFRTRAAAAWGLGKIGSEVALQALRDLPLDKTKTVRDAVADATSMSGLRMEVAGWELSGPGTQEDVQRALVGLLHASATALIPPDAVLYFEGNSFPHVLAVMRAHSIPEPQNIARLTGGIRPPIFHICPSVAFAEEMDSVLRTGTFSGGVLLYRPGEVLVHWFIGMPIMLSDGYSELEAEAIASALGTTLSTVG